MVLTPPRLVEMANFFSVKNHLRCRSNHIFSRKEFHSFDTSLHFANVGLSTNRNICSARWCSPGFEMKCWILMLCSSDFIVRWSKWRCLLFTFTLFDNFILTNDASWLMLLPYLVMPAKHDKKTSASSERSWMQANRWAYLPYLSCPSKFRIRTLQNTSKNRKRRKNSWKFVYNLAWA